MISKRYSCKLPYDQKIKRHSDFFWNRDGEEKVFRYRKIISKVQETNFRCNFFPFLCNIHTPQILQHTSAEDNKLINLEAYSAIESNFYIDDDLQSFNTTENEAIITTEVNNTIQKDGFRLTKFFSNNPNAVMKITGENSDTVTEQRMLRQMWNAKEDIFIFKRPELS